MNDAEAQGVAALFGRLMFSLQGKESESGRLEALLAEKLEEIEALKDEVARLRLEIQDFARGEGEGL